MPSKEIYLGPANVGAVLRIRITFRKKNTAGSYVAWTGIDSIALTFENPDRTTQFSRTMTLEDDTNGIWYYDTTSSDFTEEGYWTLQPVVTDGTIVIPYAHEISIEIVEQP